MIAVNFGKLVFDGDPIKKNSNNDHFQGLLPSKEEAAIAATGQPGGGGATQTADLVQNLFIVALMWSLGALLELDDRFKVSYIKSENA